MSGRTVVPRSTTTSLSTRVGGCPASDQHSRVSPRSRSSGSARCGARRPSPVGRRGGRRSGHARRSTGWCRPAGRSGAPARAGCRTRLRSTDRCSAAASASTPDSDLAWTSVSPVAGPGTHSVTRSARTGRSPTCDEQAVLDDRRSAARARGCAETLQDVPGVQRQPRGLTGLRAALGPAVRVLHDQGAVLDRDPQPADLLQAQPAARTGRQHGGARGCGRRISGDPATISPGAHRDPGSSSRGAGRPAAGGPARRRWSPRAPRPAGRADGLPETDAGAIGQLRQHPRRTGLVHRASCAATAGPGNPAGVRRRAGRGGAGRASRAVRTGRARRRSRRPGCPGCRRRPGSCR